MNTHLIDNQPRILQSCYVNVSRSGEHFVPNHTLSYVVNGRNDIYLNSKTHSFGEGEFRFTAKNQLAKFTKYPSPTAAFKSISVVIDQHTLRSISEEYNLHQHKAYTGETLLSLKPVPMLQNFIASLSPYMNGTSELNTMITQLKVKEAAMILLETNPNLHDLLFDFDPPGKIDLKAYMLQHYKFNVGLDRFAYLTGRSLATFKRDFQQTFQTSPNKWLQDQRLKEAHFLLKEQGRKVSDVYLDAGFKDLSHFSFAFKKAFGTTPSKI
jgi:AraC-like DNA-binding protein